MFKYKPNWILHTGRMQTDGFPKVIKHYKPHGKKKPDVHWALKSVADMDAVSICGVIFSYGHISHPSSYPVMIVVSVGVRTA
jgi:hypothetical protein